MECTCIPYTRLPKTSPLFLDYLYRHDRVAPFYNGSPFDFPSFRGVASELNISADGRRRLAEILRRQNEAFGCSDATRSNIELLTQPDTYAVVTGQQVGLLSGPAYTLYKALTAVRLARSLTEQGLTCVPVFWLATEDHDLEEVSRTATFDDDCNLVPLSDAGERPAPRCSVGYVRLSREIATTLDRLESLLPAGSAREELLRDLRESYKPGVAWGEAFARFMARLFGRFGVVLLDALDVEVHDLAAPVYRRAISEAPALRRLLLDRSDELVRAGYHAQVHVTEESVLLFATRDGNRTALHQHPMSGAFSLDGEGEFSAAEISSRIETAPIEFSPNALLRPVVQDVLLPTVAYVAGPSELAYHAQTRVLYPRFGRPQPVLFPRAGFSVLDQRARRLLDKYRLRVDDTWQGEEHLERKIAAVAFSEGWSERLDETEKELARLLERLRADIEQLDPTLLDPLKHAEEKMKYQMERLKGRITRAALERSEMLRRHAQMLLRYLVPDRDLQERQVTGVSFLGRAGYRLLDQVLSQIQVRSADHQVLTY